MAEQIEQIFDDVFAELAGLDDIGELINQVESDYGVELDYTEESYWNLKAISGTSLRRKFGRLRKRMLALAAKTALLDARLNGGHDEI